MTALDRNGRIVGAVGLLALGTFVLAALLVGFPVTGTTSTMGSMGMMGGMSGMGLAAFLFMLLPLVGALALGYVGIQALAADGTSETEPRHTSRGAADEDPVERLKRRYTEGELNEDEFEEALDQELSAEDGETEGHAGGDSASKERSDPAYDR